MATELFARLAAAIHQQTELPDQLAAELWEIVASADVYAGAIELVTELARQVEDYDPYAGVGCFGETCSAATIEGTLRRIRAFPS